jgi:hypothetical protein
MACRTEASSLRRSLEGRMGGRSPARALLRSLHADVPRAHRQAHGALRERRADPSSSACRRPRGRRDRVACGSPGAGALRTRHRRSRATPNDSDRRDARGERVLRGPTRRVDEPGHSRYGARVPRRAPRGTARSCRRARCRAPRRGALREALLHRRHRRRCPRALRGRRARRPQEAFLADCDGCRPGDVRGVRAREPRRELGAMAREHLALDWTAPHADPMGAGVRKPRDGAWDPSRRRPRDGMARRRPCSSSGRSPRASRGRRF